MRSRFGLCLVLFICVHIIHGQTSPPPIPRQLQAIRNTSKLKIDGNLSDSAWKSASKMDSLVEFRPKVGAVEEFGVRTETFLMYDDEGIYFGGYCHERTKDSIAYELKGRDGFGMNDYIGIIFDTYKDHQN